MKQTRSEMRGLLETDELKVLRDTWYEYSDDKALPTEDRPILIEAILDLMLEQGDIVADPSPPKVHHFTLPDLARELGINPKVARDKYRKARNKGEAPDSIKSTGWMFNKSDKKKVTDIIKPRRKK